MYTREVLICKKRLLYVKITYTANANKDICLMSLKMLKQAGILNNAVNAAKSNSESEQSIIYTSKYLDLSVRKLILRLDSLKVDFNKLETSFLNEQIDLDSADVIAFSRKRLCLIINFTEKLREDTNKNDNNEICRAMDSIYRMLLSIKEQISKILDARVASVIDEIESIIEFSNGHIRNIVLTMNEKSIEATLSMSITNISSNSVDEIKIDDITTEDECEIVYEHIITNSFSNVVKSESSSESEKLEISGTKLDNINQMTYRDHIKKMQEQKSNKDAAYGKSPSNTVVDTSNTLDKNLDDLGDYPQSDLSSFEDCNTDSSSSSEAEILQEGPNNFSRLRIWNIRRVMRKHKATLMNIKRNIADML